MPQRKRSAARADEDERHSDIIVAPKAESRPSHGSSAADAGDPVDVPLAASAERGPDQEGSSKSQPDHSTGFREGWLKGLIMAPQDGQVDHARELRDRLLRPLRMHFLAAAQAYEDYLHNGRSYLFACSLRRTNASARQLLLTWGHLLGPEHSADAIALVRHYDVWLTLWDEHSARLKPAMADPFVFENSVNFPKSAQERLMALYQRLS